MSLEELQALRATLGATDIGLARTVEESRANFEQMLSGVPIEHDVTFTPETIAGVPAIWSDEAGLDTAAVLLYLHGGAFAIGSAYGYRTLWSALAHEAGARGLALDYRLAPEHPFPAAVDDALAVYRELLDRGQDPAAIVVAGDSAGGGLAISLLVAARDAGLAMPGAVACLSPWTDLACTGDSMLDKADEDVSLRAGDLLELAAHYHGAAVSATHPLASPIHADLSGLPPILVQVGSSEILLDDAVRLARRAGSCGVPTTLEVWPGMPHVWHLFAVLLSEARDARAAAGTFLANNMYRGPGTGTAARGAAATSRASTAPTRSRASSSGNGPGT